MYTTSEPSTPTTKKRYIWSVLGYDKQHTAEKD